MTGVGAKHMIQPAPRAMGVTNICKRIGCVCVCVCGVVCGVCGVCVVRVWCVWCVCGVRACVVDVSVFTRVCLVACVRLFASLGTILLSAPSTLTQAKRRHIL